MPGLSQFISIKDFAYDKNVYKVRDADYMTLIWEDGQDSWGVHVRNAYMREFHYLADAKSYAINMVEHCSERYPATS